jgi:hypothetical protein
MSFRLSPAVLPFDPDERAVVLDIFEAYPDPYDIQLALLGRISWASLSRDIVDALFVAHGWEWPE